MPFLCAQERDWWRSNNGGDSNWAGRGFQDKTLRGWDLLSVFSPACLDSPDLLDLRGDLTVDVLQHDRVNAFQVYLIEGY